VLALYAWDSVLRTVELCLYNADYTKALVHIDVLNANVIHLLMFLFQTFTIDKRQVQLWACVTLLTKSSSSFAQAQTALSFHQMLAMSRLMTLFACKLFV
jgi:hypothetical protein